MSIGIDSYSYHRYFGETTPWEKPAAIHWQTEDFLRRAAALKVDCVSLQTAYLPPLIDAHMASERDRLRAQLNETGLQPVLAWGHRSGLEGGTNSQKIEDLHRWLEIAPALGCTLMRVVGGDQTYWSTPASERISRLTPILRDVCAAAQSPGLTIAIENHADFSMCDLVRLVENVGVENFGICFDTGNTVRVGDDLLEAARLAAPYVRMVHTKDMIPQAGSHGRPDLWWPGAPLGRGHQDVIGVIAVLRAANYTGRWFVEIPNLHPDFTDEDTAVAESVAYLRQHLR